MAQPIYPNADGSVILYDGSKVYIVDVQYSSDGVNYWEKKYTDLEHYYENDNTIKLEPHKYIRFKHSGDTVWQTPAKFIGDNGHDGKDPIIALNEGVIQWQYSGEEDWNDIIDSELLIGPQGPMGQGWEIDDAGSLDLRQSCCGEVKVSTCNTCNPNSGTISALSTFLSLGNHVLTEADIINHQYHSVNGVSWTETLIDHVGTYANSWGAIDAAGTDAITCNAQGYVVALASLVAPYESKGRVYVCADGLWTEVMNITQPTGYVKTSVNDNLEFLEAKVDDETLEAYDSGQGYEDNIRIKDDGVNESKIISSSIGDGLNGGSGDIIVADPTDFDGFGLKEYTSDTDGLDDTQVDVPVLCGDAIEPQDDNVNVVDGEDRQLFKVKPSDLINSPNATNVEYTGLATSTQLGFVEEDSFDNLFVKEGDCIDNDADGVNVRSDELTIAALDLKKLKVLETDSNTIGIQAKHIHKNAVDEMKGLKKANDTTGSIEVKPDPDGSIGFTGTGEVEVPDDGIRGVHLNDDTCDNAKGVEILNDKIVVKVDDTTIEFNGSGQLQVVEAYIQGLIDAGVASLVVDGEPEMTGDIRFNANNSNGLISLVIAGSGAADGVISFTTDVDESLLTTFITDVINSVVTDDSIYQRIKATLVEGAGIALTPDNVAKTIEIASTATPPTSGSVTTLDGSKSDGVLDTYARADHKHDVDDDALTIAKTSGLQAELDKKLELDTSYGNTEITSNGLKLKSPSGYWYYLVVDDNGNLGTQKV